MITLPQQYKVKGQRGFVYNLLNREGDIALSEQFDVELNEVVGYEVFAIQKYPDRMSPDGKTFIAAKEAPPRSELWGSHGFTVSTLEKATIRFQQMIAAELVKNKPAEPQVEVEGVDISKELAMMESETTTKKKSTKNETRSTKSSKGGDTTSKAKASRSKKGA